MFRRMPLFFGVGIIAALLLSACSGAGTGTAPTQAPDAQSTQPPAAEPTAQPIAQSGDAGSLPEVDPVNLSGNVIVAGSSTVYPLTERMVERFEDEGFGGRVTIDSVGSGAGFERFCVAGETDIAAASRPIKEAEVENCAAINRTPIEFRVGTDALAVVVSSENDFLTDLTLAELALIFSADAVRWSDVNPSWPGEDIQRFSPGTDSGTFDYFVEAVLAPAYGEEDGRNAILNAANIQFSEDDNVLVQGVEGSPYAIGYFGFAYYAENQGALTAMSVNGVSPSAETAENGEYPLARPLFIYSDAGVMQAKPQVAGFINFYLTYVNEEILSVGYFPASAESLEAARQAWLNAN